MSSEVHFIMQGKGGVGKTLTSCVLAQYLKSSERTVMCLDTDPVNKSFVRFKSLDVVPIALTENNKLIPTNFDLMANKIFENQADAVVVDSGATTFLPLQKYILACNLIGMLNETGCDTYIHTILVGGQGSDDTLFGLSGLIEGYSSLEIMPRIVVWLNPYFGTLEWKGKGFRDLNLYETYSEQIAHIVDLPNLDPELYGKDLELLLKSGLTFDDINEDPSITLMSKRRLFMMKKQFFEAVQKAGL